MKKEKETFNCVTFSKILEMCANVCDMYIAHTLHRQSKCIYPNRYLKSLRAE